MRQKALSLLLSIAMVFSLVPTVAIADDGAPDNNQQLEVNGNLSEQLQTLEDEATDLVNQPIFTEEEDGEPTGETTSELDQSLDDLNQTVVDNATDILNQTGVVAATGVALVATKVAAAAVSVEVRNLEGQYEQKEAEIEELEQKIQEASDAIKAAQGDIVTATAALEEAQKEVDDLPGLEEAQEELATAEDALAEAERIVAELEDIVEKLDPAKTGIDIINSDATDEEKAAAKKALTECIFAEDESFEWVDADQLIFTAGDAYFQVEVADGENDVKYVQFRKLSRNSEDVVADVTDDDLANLKSGYDNLTAYNMTYKRTGLTAVENEGTSYEVLAQLSRTRSLTLYVVVGSSVVKLEQAQGAWSFTTRTGIKKVQHTVSLITTGEDVTFVPTEEVFDTTSLAATGAWDEANAQLPGAISDRDTAEANKNTAEALVEEIEGKIEALDQAQATLDEAERALKESTADKAANEAALAEAKDELKAIKKELKGNVVEQLVVATIHGNLEEALTAVFVDFDPTEYLSEEDAAKYREYMASGSLWSLLKALPLLSKAKDAVLKEAEEQAQPILELISSVQENGFTLETATAAYNVLTDTNLSANTKQAFVDALSDYLGNSYESATSTLQQIITDSRASTVEAISNAGSSAINTIRNEGISGVRSIVQSTASSISRSFGRLFR